MNITQAFVVECMSNRNRSVWREYPECGEKQKVKQGSWATCRNCGENFHP